MLIALNKRDKGPKFFDEAVLYSLEDALKSEGLAYY